MMRIGEVVDKAAARIQMTLRTKLVMVGKVFRILVHGPSDATPVTTRLVG